MKTLVAYYTWQGHTGKVAKALASRIGRISCRSSLNTNPACS